MSHVADPYTPVDAQHRLVDVPGGRIHLVEQGRAPSSSSPQADSSPTDS